MIRAQANRQGYRFSALVTTARRPPAPSSAPGGWIMRPIVVAMALGLSACGGGTTMESSLAYSTTAEARHSYTSHDYFSHISVWGRGDAAPQVYIGGDLEPREPLRHIFTQNSIRWFMGASRDGVGVARLENYERDLTTANDTDPHGREEDGFYPFIVQPSLYLDSELDDRANNEIWLALLDSTKLINDALPPEYQIRWSGYRDFTTAYVGEIVVSLENPASIGTICGANAVACTLSSINRSAGWTESSTLYIPDDFDTSEYQYSRSVIVHELLHALGIWGHVDSVEFPDSLMGAAGEYVPNLGHIISKIDREVLQIMYMSQRSDLYNDWGEWSDVSFHLIGQSEDDALRFGVALFNGLPQPWVKGTAPDTPLAENQRLFGTATWNGVLFGYSGASPIKGDASLQVRLTALDDPNSEHDLRFRDIYFLNRFESDWSDASDRWFDTRDIDYKVSMWPGNQFRNVTGEGYEEGLVTGTFAGPGHEHMGGTVKRTDMIAAFGGSR